MQAVIPGWILSGSQKLSEGVASYSGMLDEGVT